MHDENLETAILFAQMPPFDPSAPAKNIRLALNSDLLRIARHLDVDVAQTCERALGECIRELLWQGCVRQAKARQAEKFKTRGRRLSHRG